MAQHQLDVCGVCEMHVPFASLLPPFVDGSGRQFVTVSAPVPRHLRTGQSHPKGGLGVMVNCSSNVVLQVSVVPMQAATHVRSCVSWFRLHLDPYLHYRDIMLAVVHLPPNPVRCLSGFCEDDFCPRDHTRQILHGLCVEAADLEGQGDVVIVGDFNACPPLSDVRSWPGPPYCSVLAKARFTAVSQVLLGTGSSWCPLELLNTSARTLSPTRFEPTTGAYTVLDLALVNPSAGIRVGDGGFSTHKVAVSDHFLLVLPVVPADDPSVASEGADGGSGAPTELPEHVHLAKRSLHPRFHVNRASLLKTPHNKELWEYAGAVMDQWWQRQQDGGRLPSPVEAARAECFMLSKVGILTDRAARVDPDATLVDLLGTDACIASRDERLQSLETIRKHKRRVRSTKRKLVQLADLIASACSVTGVPGLITNPTLLQAEQAQRDKLAANKEQLFRAFQAHRHIARDLQSQQRQAIADLQAKALRSSDAPFQVARIMGAICKSTTEMRTRAGKQAMRVPRSVASRQMSMWYTALCAKYGPDKPPVSEGQWRAVGVPRQGLLLTLLDKDFTGKEVLAGISRLRNQSAALFTPIMGVRRLARVADEHMADGLAAVFNNILSNPDTLPPEYTTVALTPILKPGKKATGNILESFRTIGYGASHSRLLQTLINTRATNFMTSTGFMHPAQAGFMPRLSAEMLVWLVLTITEDEELANAPVYKVFVDVKAAFASVQHTDIATALAVVGLTGKLGTLMLKFITKARVYAVQHGLMTDTVQCTVGLIEGVTFDPICWNIVKNPLLKRIDALLLRLHDRGLDLGPLLNGVPFITAAYADDLLCQCRSLLVCESAMGITVPFYRQLNMELGHASDKTALLKPPPGRPARLIIDGREAAVTEQYKYLGYRMHHQGVAASARLHFEVQLARYHSAIGRLSHAGMRQARVSVCLVAFVTRVRAVIAYAISLWGTAQTVTAWGELQRDDVNVLRAIMKAGGIPVPVVRAMLPIPSLQCVLDRSVLRLLLCILRLDRASRFRTLLAHVARRWRRAGEAEVAALRGTWWPRVRARLATLDALPMRHDLANCPYRDPGVRLVPLIEQVLLEQMPVFRERSIIQRIDGVLRYVTDWAAWVANQDAMNALPTLAATRDLLCARGCDGALPLLRRPRSRHQTILLHLPAGVHYLLGHEHWEATCPWCMSAVVDVPHLLRDCTWWRRKRRALQSELRSLAVAHRIMDIDTPVEGDDGFTADVACHWYHLIVGHAVPQTFLACTVFPSTSPDAPGRTGPPERPHASHLSAYQQLLDMSAPFVEQVVVLTQRIFGAVERAHGRRRLELDGGLPLPARPSGGWEWVRRLWRRGVRDLRHRASHCVLFARIMVVLGLCLLAVFCVRLLSPAPLPLHPVPMWRGA